LQIWFAVIFDLLPVGKRYFVNLKDIGPKRDKVLRFLARVCAKQIEARRGWALCDGIVQSKNTNCITVRQSFLITITLSILK